MTPEETATSVSHEHLHDFVARFVGKDSRGVRSLTYANSPELHGNSMLRQLKDEDASQATLDAGVREIVTESVRPLGAGVQALAGVHPDTLAQSHPKRRSAARKALNLKDQGNFNTEIEPLYIASIVEALAPMVGVATRGGRQLQHEYEVLSRESEYVIDPDNHLRVDHWTKVRIRALGAQVRLFHGLYTRKMIGRAPKPEILSGQKLLGHPRLESAEDSRYFFGVYLGRTLDVGKEETIEYRNSFADRAPCEPFYQLGLHNPYNGYMSMTIRLPVEYVARGLLFRITDPGGVSDEILWTEKRRFGSRSFDQARVDLDPRRAVIRWNIRPALMGYKYELRWTNELVTELKPEGMQDG